MTTAVEVRANLAFKAWWKGFAVKDADRGARELARRVWVAAWAQAYEQAAEDYY